MLRAGGEDTAALVDRAVAVEAKIESRHGIHLAAGERHDRRGVETKVAAASTLEVKRAAGDVHGSTSVEIFIDIHHTRAGDIHRGSIQDIHGAVHIHRAAGDIKSRCRALADVVVSGSSRHVERAAGDVDGGAWGR